MRGRDRIAQAVWVLVFCGLGGLIIFLPRLLHPPPPGSSEGAALTPAGIRSLLARVEDPELGISITDLGLVREIEVSRNGEVSVTLIFTSPFCPLSDLILSRVRSVLAGADGVRSYEVTVDRNAVWTPEMMSRRGRRMLRELLR